MRIGYAIGEASFIKAFDKVRNHFGVTRASQIAALTALGDEAWLQSVVERVAAARRRLYAIAQENGLAAVESATNFVAIDCGRDGAYAVNLCTEAVELLFSASGARGLYTSGDLQRQFRDAHAINAHIAFNFDAAGTNYGRVALDLPSENLTL